MDTSERELNEQYARYIDALDAAGRLDRPGRRVGVKLLPDGRYGLSTDEVDVWNTYIE